MFFVDTCYLAVFMLLHFSGIVEFTSLTAVGGFGGFSGGCGGKHLCCISIIKRKYA